MKAIHLGMLRRALTIRYYGYGEGRDNLPKDMQGIFENMPVYSKHPREHIGLFTIMVNPGSDRMKRGRYPHRIFVLIKDRWVPAGRVAQIK